MKNELENKDEKFYFCPHCRTISYENDLFYTQKGNKFKCINCNKSFNARSYSDVAVTNGGKPYHIMEHVGDGEDVEQSIIISITYLYWDGYTQREIQEITRFSQEIISKAMKWIYDEAPNEMETVTKKQFIRSKLGVSELSWNTYKNKEYNASVKTLKNFEKTIIKAYNFGCTYSNIEVLFQVSSKTVSTIINANMDKIHLTCHYQMTIEGSKVTISKKTRLRKKRKKIEPTFP